MSVHAKTGEELEVAEDREDREEGERMISSPEGTATTIIDKEQTAVVVGRERERQLIAKARKIESWGKKQTLECSLRTQAGGDRRVGRVGLKATASLDQDPRLVSKHAKWNCFIFTYSFFLKDEARKEDNISEHLKYVQGPPKLEPGLQ